MGHLSSVETRNVAYKKQHIFNYKLSAGLYTFTDNLFGTNQSRMLQIYKTKFLKISDILISNVSNFLN